MSKIIMENENGVKLTCENFEYRTLGRLRFIGIDAWRTGEEWDVLWARRSEFMPLLDELMVKYATDITADCSMMHHNGNEVDSENHYVAGRFFKEGTPVPEGYDSYDVPTEQAAYAFYSVNKYDGDIGLAYYCTRDQILSDGNKIPYPHAYWHASVYTNGRRPIDWHAVPQKEGLYRFGYMFSVSDIK